MATIFVIWDDDPGGNAEHIALHGVTKEEVEEVLDSHYEDYFFSREEPHNPITFGDTTTGKYIAVVFEVVEPDPPTVYPITAYEAPPPAAAEEREEEKMTVKRVQRKVERTPEEQARIDATREKYQREKPGPDQVAASAGFEGAVQAGAYWEVRGVMAQLKAERQRQGLTLAQLAERSGVDKGAISKLETGRQVNPTVDTLSRIAAGLGIRVGLTLQSGAGEQTRRDGAGQLQPQQARP